MRIGFIGLGLMGFPMAKRVLQAGFPLTVWNRTASKADELVTMGAVLAASPAELAKTVDIILLSLTDESAVESVLNQHEGILENALPSQIIIDHSTISPVSARLFANRLAEKEIVYVDAPVTGGTPGAESGKLTCFLGAEERVIATIKPVISSYVENFYHMGEAGSGQVTKLCNQHLLFINQLAICEMLNLAEQLNIDLTKLKEAFEHTLFQSPVWRIYGGAIIDQQSKKFAHIKTLLKDLEYVHEAASSANSPIPLASTATEWIRLASNRGLGEEDITALIKIFK